MVFPGIHHLFLLGKLDFTESVFQWRILPPADKGFHGVYMYNVGGL